jgi:hypothetical protein
MKLSRAPVRAARSRIPEAEMNISCPDQELRIDANSVVAHPHSKIVRIV